jgi:CheY-like chemotaxis protein
MSIFCSFISPVYQNSGGKESSLHRSIHSFCPLLFILLLLSLFTNILGEKGLFLEKNCCRILLAEDDSINRLYITSLLKSRSCTVDHASDGIQALSMAGEQIYDLILMDVSMPGMDGTEATKQIRALELKNNTSPVPVIALTAHTGQEDIDSCSDCGMDDFITKPFSESHFFEVLDSWLHKACRSSSC